MPYLTLHPSPPFHTYAVVIVGHVLGTCTPAQHSRKGGKSPFLTCHSLTLVTAWYSWNLHLATANLAIHFSADHELEETRTAGCVAVKPSLMGEVQEADMSLRKLIMEDLWYFNRVARLGTLQAIISVNTHLTLRLSSHWARGKTYRARFVFFYSPYHQGTTTLVRS